MTLQAGIGLSINPDYMLAVREAMAEARKNTAVNKIDLALVFSSVEFAHLSVVKARNSLLPEAVPIVGCSSLAIISNKGIFKHGLMVALLSLPKDACFNAACVQEIKAKTSAGAGKELADKLLYGFSGVRRDLSVLFSDGLIDDCSGLVSGLREKLGWSFPLIGALASTNINAGKTYVYFNNGVCDNAACGFLLGGKINFGFGVKHGWKPLGKPRRVTRSIGNVIYEINGLPAVKLYEEYLAKEGRELKDDLKRISVFYPIGVYIPGEEEYLLRNIIDIGKDGSLICRGDVQQDSRIRLMIGTKESCLEATQQAAEEIKVALGGRKIDFALVFDSVSRHALLGRQAIQELEIIRKVLGADVPLAGIYTYGEQAPLRAINYLGKTYFHNQTITILGMAS